MGCGAVKKPPLLRLLLGGIVAAIALGAAVLPSLPPGGVPAPAAALESLDDPGLRFPNVLLTTQDGRQVRFYDDLVKGRIVTLNFMYIECGGT